MPELPEMENYKRLLTKKIGERTITDVQVNREKSINVATNEFINRVQHHQIVEVKRRAKYLVFTLDTGDKLLLHLMLGGWMFYGAGLDKPDRTIQIRLSFGEEHLYFIGLRLGYLHLLTQQQLDEELQDLGSEPLDINYSLDAFLSDVREKRGKLKAALVDQQFLAGIGNRYSDEICWDAQLLPTRQTNELSNEESVRLYHSIRHVLQQGLKHGGYMDTPLYVNDHKTGRYHHFFKVYNREAENCPRCGTTITRDEVSSRKCFYCTACQQ
ncbi:Fpg/Nei family DNA glycosylase [Aquibacillus sediminis]|uniref:Fpg/Nei family DNA glycosylase n=1 Tax=Aquibacillus sediminis TaxID=2574734 RepID=UPI0011094C92|nr:DNA-formamidopyrimidine glycosylase family protein [Aquibacillus sediminis]